jgi:hypothetical protein
VTESCGHTIEATDVAPAAAALCALRVTLGSEDVETVSPAEARTCPMTVSELVVAGESTIASVELAESIVTVRCEIAWYPGAPT